MIENLEERINRSEARLFKTVFSNDTNHYNTLFGGAALAIMDDVAFIAGTRFCRLPLVTVATERVEFKIPISQGTIIETVGRVESVGNTSLKIKVTVFVEYMYEERREKAIEGMFTMVAIDENRRPVQIR